MGEDLTRGDNAETNREPSASSGWVTTQQAARSLGIQPRTVRWHIENGNLEAKPQGEGVKRAWLVSIDSLQSFRDARQRQGSSPGTYRAEQEAADIAAESSGSAVRELADRLVEEAARAAEFRVRLEISERAQSTLEEELAEERRRREEAERIAEELRREIKTLQQPRESPTPSPAASEGASTTPDTVGTQAATQPPQDEPRRSWWRRMFGG